MAFWEVGAPFGAETSRVEGARTDAAPAHPLGQDATDGGDAAGKLMLWLPKEVPAEFPTEGKAAAHLPDETFVLAGSLRRPDPAGTPRASHETVQAGRVESLPPSVAGGSGAADGFQGQLPATTLAAEPVVEAEFFPALDGLLGSRVINGQPAVEWAGQSFHLHVSRSSWLSLSTSRLPENGPGGALRSAAGVWKLGSGYALPAFPDRNFLASIPSLRPTPLEPGFTPNPVSHVSEPRQVAGVRFFLVPRVRYRSFPKNRG